MSIYARLLPSALDLLATTINLIKQEGDCSNVECGDCPINRIMCSHKSFTNEDKMKILIAYVIVICGEQQAKEFLTETLI